MLTIFLSFLLLRLALSQPHHEHKPNRSRLFTSILSAQGCLKFTQFFTPSEKRKLRRGVGHGDRARGAEE